MVRNILRNWHNSGISNRPVSLFEWANLTPEVKVLRNFDVRTICSNKQIDKTFVFIVEELMTVYRLQIYYDISAISQPRLNYATIDTITLR